MSALGGMGNDLFHLRPVHLSPVKITKKKFSESHCKVLRYIPTTAQRQDGFGSQSAKQELY